MNITLGVSILGPCCSIAADPKEPAKEIDPFSVLLIAEDVNETTDLLTRLDDNEDGCLEAKEYQRLPWAKDITQFDLNHDSRLTHIELCVWAALERAKLGIDKMNVAGARKWMNQYDMNKNGWLDADEIRDGGWPKQPAEFDTDKNGSISLMEIAGTFAARRDMRSTVGVLPFDQTRAIRFMAAHDLDGNGQLSSQEAPDSMLPQPHGKHAGVDGLLSILDLGEMFSTDRKEKGVDAVDQEKALNMILGCDKNCDAAVDREEILLPGGSLLVEYDSNADGIVRLDEIIAVLGKSKREFGFTAADSAAAQLLLKRHDRNRNGTIEADELFKTSEASQGRLTVDLMPVIDKDGDKALTLEELAQYTAKHQSRERSNSK